MLKDAVEKGGPQNYEELKKFIEEEWEYLDQKKKN